jgi:hypothetical protein
MPIGGVSGAHKRGLRRAQTGIEISETQHTAGLQTSCWIVHGLAANRGEMF